MIQHTGHGDGPLGVLTSWWCCLASLERSFQMIYTLGSWLGEGYGSTASGKDSMFL